MTIEAKITNRTHYTVYVMGFPLEPGKAKNFSFYVGKILIDSEVGYVLLDERGTYEANSKLQIENKNVYDYDVVTK